MPRDRASFLFAQSCHTPNSCFPQALGGIYSTLNRKRGHVFSEEQRPGYVHVAVARPAAFLTPPHLAERRCTPSARTSPSPSRSVSPESSARPPLDRPSPRWSSTTGRVRAPVLALPALALTREPDPVMPGDITEKASKVEQLVLDIRKRKGLKPDIPTLDQFYDKL